jgi:hypothetical protein
MARHCKKGRVKFGKRKGKCRKRAYYGRKKKGVTKNKQKRVRTRKLYSPYQANVDFFSPKRRSYGKMPGLIPVVDNVVSPIVSTVKSVLQAPANIINQAQAAVGFNVNYKPEGISKSDYVQLGGSGNKEVNYPDFG